MDSGRDGVDELRSLRERAKELSCLYAVNAALARRDEPLPSVFLHVLEALPPAWQFAAHTSARIEYFGRTHALPDFLETPWQQSAPIEIWRTPVGRIQVVYAVQHPATFEGPFLREERQLLDAVAQRVGEFLEWKQRELGGDRVGADPEHWRWRQRFAERIAAAIDPQRFGVRMLYLHGSTELGSANIGSDIDLIVVCEGDTRQRELLATWLEGWNLCLAEVRSQLHGVSGEGVLDVRFLDPAEAERALLSSIRAGSGWRALPLGTGVVGPVRTPDTQR